MIAQFFNTVSGDDDSRTARRKNTNAAGSDGDECPHDQVPVWQAVMIPDHILDEDDFAPSLH